MKKLIRQGSAQAILGRAEQNAAESSNMYRQIHTFWSAPFGAGESSNSVRIPDRSDAARRRQKCKMVSGLKNHTNPARPKLEQPEAVHVVPEGA